MSWHRRPGQRDNGGNEPGQQRAAPAAAKNRCVEAWCEPAAETCKVQQRQQRLPLAVDIQSAGARRPYGKNQEMLEVRVMRACSPQ